MSENETHLRFAELMAALSIATDMGMGQPIEQAMTTSIVAVRLGEAAGLTDSEMRDAYYESLLRYIGCNADAHWAASVFGDEVALSTEILKLDTADNPRAFGLLMRHMHQANLGSNPLQVMWAIAQDLPQLFEITNTYFPGHCEVAQRLATRLDFPESFVETVGQIYARWDGKGVPHLKGDAISRARLVAGLAQDAVIFYRLGGVEAAVTVAKKRSGAHSPELVETFCDYASEILMGLDDEPNWETVLSLEPGEQLRLTEAEFDNACEVIADFADIKSPFFLNHSRHVADLAARSAEECGLPANDVKLLRRAGYLHDIGKVGISARIWSSDALSARDWERVRLHPYYTERVLANSPELARVGALAALHHERLDGSGYFRGVNAANLSIAARVLAAANKYCALTEDRPHRAAYHPERAAGELNQEVRAGRLDGDVVKAVLVAAGHQAVKKEVVAGLSSREVEILRLLARGNTMKEIASELTISFKTVDRHVQNIYTKINVSTRAAATLFAMENNLL